MLSRTRPSTSTLWDSLIDEYSRGLAHRLVLSRARSSTSTLWDSLIDSYSLGLAHRRVLSRPRSSTSTLWASLIDEYSLGLPHRRVLSRTRSSASALSDSISSALASQFRNTLTMTIRHVTAESVCRIRLPSSSKAPFLHSIQNGWLVDRRHALLAHTHGDANRQIVGLSHETDPELSPCPPLHPAPGSRGRRRSNARPGRYP